MKKNSFVTKLLFMLVFIPLYSCVSSAEDIKVLVGQQSAELNNIDRPKAGMSKTKVTEQFGQPLKENPARGKPPISSWEYENFVVYFESDTVIHSVLKSIQHVSREVHTKEEVEMPANNPAPKPAEEPSKVSP